MLGLMLYGYIKVKMHLTTYLYSAVPLYEVFVIVLLWLAFESSFFVANSVNLG